MESHIRNYTSLFLLVNLTFFSAIGLSKTSHGDSRSQTLIRSENSAVDNKKDEKYTCPKEGRYAPNDEGTGFCLWEDLILPKKARAYCSYLKRG